MHNLCVGEHGQIEHFGIKAEKISLAIHYYFVLLRNLKDFLKVIKVEDEVGDIDLKNINSTNIFNVHSIFHALETIRSSKKGESISKFDAKLIKGFRIRVSATDKLAATEEELVIPLEFVSQNSKSISQLFIVICWCLTV